MQNVDFPQLVGPTYSMASLNADCQRCMNLQLESIESGKGANQFYLRETPGLRLVYDFSALGAYFVGKKIQGILASTVVNNILWIVIGNELIKFFLDGSFPHSSLGYNMYTPANTTTFLPMQLVENKNGLFIAPAVPAFYTATVGAEAGNKHTIGLFTLPYTANISPSKFSSPVDPIAVPTTPLGYTGLCFLEFLNNRFITINLDFTTGNLNNLTPNPVPIHFQISPASVQTPANAGVWSILEQYGVISNIDQLIAIKVNGSELWCFGTDSYEVHTDVGGENLNVYQRIRDAAYKIGCIGSGTVQQLNDRVFWLSRSTKGSGIVYMSNGLNAERISTIAIEALIQPFVRSNTDAPLNVAIDPAYCYAWVYSITGHVVYVLTLLPTLLNPTLAPLTIAYDMTTGQWHELSYRDPITGAVSQHRCRFSVNTGTMQLLTDHTLPYIYELSPTVYTDNLAPIIRYRRSPVLLDNNRRVFFSRLIFNMEVGVGLNAGDDPLISVRWSNDNAHTFGNYHTTGIGSIGKYMQQVVFNRLGSSLRRVFEIYFDAAVPFRLITAELGLDIGAH